MPMIWPSVSAAWIDRRGAAGAVPAACADCVEEALRCETLERLHRIYAFDTRYDSAYDVFPAAAEGEE